MFIETPGKVKIIQKDQRLDISNISLTLCNFFHMKKMCNKLFHSGLHKTMEYSEDFGLKILIVQ